MARVALVTGANQGIGFEIVRQLCKQLDGTVFLASRNVQRGREAVEQLKSEGLSPELLILDVDSIDSIRATKEEVKKKYGRLDILINNAGISQGQSPLAEAAKSVIHTNYYGVVNVTNIFYPLLQPNSRVIHITSGMGDLSHISEEWKQKILSPDLTVDSLSAIMDQFVQDAQTPDCGSKGWPTAPEHRSPAYRVSKMGVSRLAELHAETLTSDPEKPGILVNAVCPGWVRTNMGTAAATRSVEQGADTPVYLALLPPGACEPNGQALRDRKVYSWK